MSEFEIRDIEPKYKYELLGVIDKNKKHVYVLTYNNFEFRKELIDVDAFIMRAKLENMNTNCKKCRINKKGELIIDSDIPRYNYPKISENISSIDINPRIKSAEEIETIAQICGGCDTYILFNKSNLSDRLKVAILDTDIDKHIKKFCNRMIPSNDALLRYNITYISDCIEKRKKAIIGLTTVYRYLEEEVLRENGMSEEKLRNKRLFGNYFANSKIKLVIKRYIIDFEL